VLAAAIDRPEQLTEKMGTVAVHEFFAARQKSMAQVDSIGLVGVDGRLISGSRQWPVSAIDLADRDYFTYFREHDDPGVFIGKPARNRASGDWAFFVARRINGATGEFAGVVVASVDL